MKWHPTRDGILFVTGLAGIIWETTISPSSDPQLLVLFGAMIGLPAFLAKDRAEQ